MMLQENTSIVLQRAFNRLDKLGRMIGTKIIDAMTPLANLYLCLSSLIAMHHEHELCTKCS